jgi:hypothetical protein
MQMYENDPTRQIRLQRRSLEFCEKAKCLSLNKLSRESRLAVWVETVDSAVF